MSAYEMAIIGIGPQHLSFHFAYVNQLCAPISYNST